MLKKHNDSFKPTLIMGIVTSVITILSLCVAIFVLLDKKKKKEEKELEEYLENTIQ